MVAGLLLAALLGSGCTTPKRITTGTLLAEMTDLARLAEFPDPAFTCRQFSSYDRASRSPADAETWFANRDYGNFLRTVERGGRSEYVLMNTDGPGAIVRIWSANPKGTLRVYLDHAESPVIEAPMADLLGGRVAGFPPPLAAEASRGWNLYFPIPYARHCLVTSDEREFYYHVNYRTYAPGTSVATFSPDDLNTHAAQIDETARLLLGGNWSGLSAGPEQHGRTDVELPADERVVLWEASDGPAAVHMLRVKVAAGDLEHALRRLVLRMTFDGEETVTSPLGDFFGAAPGLNPYESLPVRVTSDGWMECRWIMPYRRTARLAICNAGDRPVRLSWGIACKPYRWTGRSLHFNAQWRVARDVATRPRRDWNYVAVEGRGVFVGAAFTIANPVRQWWGEGDEKIYVDGETFPSHFGTGTEDYYGYAWCCNVPFTHAYHNQPRCDGPGNYGWTAVNRWHVLDRIPFARRFRFDMELWHWWDGRVSELSVVTYWYARPGATSNRMELTPEALRLAELPAYVPQRVAGALEGEELRVVQAKGQPGPQPITACSNEQHLWWRGAQPGDRLVLAFQAPRAGRYRVFMRCVKAGDYGVVRVRINGSPPSAPLDFYHDGVVVSEEIPLGEFDLQRGTNYFCVEIVGANDRAVKQYMFGLDYLRVESAE